MGWTPAPTFPLPGHHHVLPKLTLAHRGPAEEQKIHTAYSNVKCHVPGPGWCQLISPPPALPQRNLYALHTYLMHIPASLHDAGQDQGLLLSMLQPSPHPLHVQTSPFLWLLPFLPCDLNSGLKFTSELSNSSQLEPGALSQTKWPQGLSWRSSLTFSQGTDNGTTETYTVVTGVRPNLK